jgi:hypothetical protein
MDGIWQEFNRPYSPHELANRFALAQCVSEFQTLLIRTNAADGLDLAWARFPSHTPWVQYGDFFRCSSRIFRGLKQPG